ncbi:hypothetical protein [Chryseobacterium tagetis]|uniref:hypothetical protein n=1 Tax=Chryseobacterium tagetis TaxID=2801334 RepID=UPI00374495C2
MNTIIGRATRIAEVKNLTNDKQVVNFSVATTAKTITPIGRKRFLRKAEQRFAKIAHSRFLIF